MHFGTLGVKFGSCKVLPKRSLACFLVILGEGGFQKGNWDGSMRVSLAFCSELGAVIASTILMLGCSISLGERLASRLKIDHWLFGPVEWGTWRDAWEELPTIMGVGALERLGSCNPSPYTLSRNVEAESICDSDASVAARDAINDGWLDG